jgi:hypothetical protein
MQDADHPNWCWAAVAASISAHLATAANPPKSQCDIATLCRGFNCCPPLPPDWKGDKPWPLEDALAKVNHDGGGPIRVSNELTFDLIRSEIAANRPVGCHIYWDNDPGHFIAIVDCVDETREFVVRDPSKVTHYNGCYTLEALKSLGGGRWDYYYPTV